MNAGGEKAIERNLIRELNGNYELRMMLLCTAKIYIFVCSFSLLFLFFAGLFPSFCIPASVEVRRSLDLTISSPDFPTSISHGRSKEEKFGFFFKFLI